MTAEATASAATNSHTPGAPPNRAIEPDAARPRRSARGSSAGPWPGVRTVLIVRPRGGSRSRAVPTRHPPVRNARAGSGARVRGATPAAHATVGPRRGGRSVRCCLLSSRLLPEIGVGPGPRRPAHYRSDMIPVCGRVCTGVWGRLTAVSSPRIGGIGRPQLGPAVIPSRWTGGLEYVARGVDAAGASGARGVLGLMPGPRLRGW